jgi:predicted SAM-dependent methyltransferase
MYKEFKKYLYRVLVPFIRTWKKLTWYYYLFTKRDIKLIVGAGPTKYQGWFHSDLLTLDVTRESHFKKYFKKKKIKKLLAEHVLEHLSEKELELMIKNFYQYSSNNVNIRIAVPDGYHSDKEYISLVKPGGTGEGADDHKHLFNYKSLSSLFEMFNFESELIEYWNEEGEFYSKYSNDENGYVHRSFINDKRNLNGVPHYTSLIVDFKKK